MRITSKLIFSCFLFVSSAVTLAAKDWRGITPLTSTRKDVEYLLGKPKTDRGDVIFYEFEKEHVSFDFSKGTCRVGSGGWNVPRDVVIGIWVMPKPKQLWLADLRLDESRYKKEQDKEIQFIVNYVDEAEGVSYEVNTSDKGMVTLVRYFPAAKDSHLRCPKTYEELEGTLKVGGYNDIPFEGEKRQLDIFTEQLGRYSHKDPHYADTLAYIMVYAGKRHRPGEAEARAKRAKDYLVKIRGIDRRRVVTIDGGYRDELTVELYLVPPGGTPPLATPTVDPSETQVVGGGRERRKGRVRP